MIRGCDQRIHKASLVETELKSTVHIGKVHPNRYTVYIVHTCYHLQHSTRNSYCTYFTVLYVCPCLTVEIMHILKLHSKTYIQYIYWYVKSIYSIRNVSSSNSSVYYVHTDGCMYDLKYCRVLGKVVSTADLAPNASKRHRGILLELPLRQRHNHCSMRRMSQLIRGFIVAFQRTRLWMCMWMS